MNYLDFFREISEIPRGSGNTRAISDYLVSFAQNRKLEYYRDDYNNVVIIKEASKGREDDEPLIIQGHMDMVAVSDDPAIDMKVTGLSLCEDEEYLWADKTSLGADDGIAVAYGLALLDSEEISHPRLEMVVTVDEEIGMLGAEKIDLSMLKGHTMLNIDSEEEGIFWVSCAGGTRMDVFYPLKNLSSDYLKDGVVYDISIDGLIGGHSGTEIDKGRANAIVLMNVILAKLHEAHLLIGINGIKGGTADNAIAACCSARIFSKAIEPELFDIIKFEALENYLGIEKDARITLKELEGYSMNPDAWYLLMDTGYTGFASTLSNGVLAMSRDIDGLVETSLNQGLISLENGEIKIGLSIRSMINDKKDDVVYAITDKGYSYGAHFDVYGDYCGWEYRADSPLRNKMIETYKRMFNEEPEVKALHAGLECGVLSQKIKDLDCVSFGPWIYDIHTTREKISLKSAERIWNFIVELISK